MSFYVRNFIMIIYGALESTLVILVRPNMKRVNSVRAFFTKRIVKAAGANIRVVGAFNAKADLIVANHQSMFDIFVLESIMGNDVRFVGRKGIMDKWPTSTVVNTVGHITIDLNDKRSIIHLIKEVKAKKGKHPVVIFPEGTRKQSGKIETFEQGAKLVAQKLDLSVQPCVIKNILDVYNEKTRHTKPGTIEVEFLPTFSNLDETWYEKMHTKMQETFQLFGAK